MSMSIMTNVASLTAQKNLSRTQSALQGNLGRLSSGLRINQAADDAAGLAVSEKLKAQSRSMSQAERNAMDGISVIQVAEGSLNEVSGILTRMRELAVQASTGTLSDTERGYLDTEFQALISEVDRVANVTEFNGIKLLDGSQSSIDLQVGINDSSNDRINLELLSLVSGLGLSGLAVSSAAGAQGALATIDTAINTLSESRAKMGAVQNRLLVTVNNLQTANENLQAANSRVRDVNIAEESASMTRNNILSQAGVSVLAQANQIPSMALSLLR